ncbi:MAG: flippase-like domain-containing protein [Coriobacteriia bacterium]|nr:flippase-like domain-containing protein [Coriobacteriia bacterium]
MTNRRTKSILVIIAAVFAIYIGTHLKELERVIDTFAAGNWRWLLVAALAQVAYFAMYSKMVQWAFRSVEIKRGIKELLPLILGALFMNVLAPTGGNSGTVLFADDAARREESSSKAVVGYMASTIVSYTAFSFVLIFAVVYLRVVGSLDVYEISGALLFILPTVLPPVLLILSVKNPDLTVRILGLVYRIVIKVQKTFKMRSRLQDDWSQSISEELIESAESIASHYGELVKAVALALAAHVVSILSLIAVFLSFNIHLRYGAIIAGYAFAEVARVISPQPEGVGAVEAIMLLIFTSFGVAPISATAISMAFRGLNFWFPLLAGFFFLRKLESFKSSP